MSDRREPAWITYEQVIAIYGRQLRRFGGAVGLRDEGLLRSALERPINKWQYEQAELAELAAAYGFGLAKNHAFVDGNKRASLIAMIVFLRANDVEFIADEATSAAAIYALAAGEIDEAGLTRWIKDNWPARV